MTTTRCAWNQWPTTLGLGATMTGAIWLAGAHDIAFLGFVLAALRPARVRTRP